MWVDLRVLMAHADAALCSACLCVRVCMCVRNGEMWTIAGDEETSAPYPQDSEVWRLKASRNA